MRTAFLLCLAGAVAGAFLAVVSAWRGQWATFWPWLALTFSTLGHAFNVLGAHLREGQRQQARQRAEVELRAMFEDAHQRQERAAVLRGEP